ncbi:phosphonate metabolism protein/1,5-bisphosphokinase (PRPP-forming) PhnN [Trinickia mobilis]|uniref:phosphonate metabolism protein/1,5-bisphosphokinase (PRPP-forming) PhnN n=1 Tax=Trinickia mobilis TaxID=2816356 RepID=UPI001A8CC4AA|nr:phosphonate metabolism protein/1,5-bisphosphokinase (PRPP-forming) PhnN [Trinickia mobilis]
MAPCGVFFFVVGPSGAGKDTLIDGAREAFAGRADVVFATRTITRPSGSPGEQHVGVDEAAFAALERAQRFLITWDAHELRYGLPRELLANVEAGRHVIANGSRAVIAALAAQVPRLVVIEVTAPADVLARRIAARGRETEAAIAARLARTVAASPDGVRTIKVMNDRSAAVGVQRFAGVIEALIRERLGAQASAGWDDYLAKLGGATLDEAAYARLMEGIAGGRFIEAEAADILRALIGELDDTEVAALARVRARRMPRIDWGRPIVVDKHSLGGVPGSRITLLVAPIVAAFGLLMPKTSSRAITSASGTADAMEAIARVDLDADEMRAAVLEAGACIVWNGRLNHSTVDDVTNAMVRPLQLDTRRWSVASIMSKKFSAGATHVVVDLPYGPKTKLHDVTQALELARLFELIGSELGMTVKAFASDGSAPVGRGIGPALELRDVLAVLDNAADAPADLRDKALRYAGHILSWAPGVDSAQRGREEAARLLASGAARRAFDRIVDAQGRRALVEPSPLTHTIVAGESGTVAQIDGWAVGTIAREAGAPACKGAGVDLLCGVGQRVHAGEAIIRIHAADTAALAAAVRAANDQCAIAIAAISHARRAGARAEESIHVAQR